MSGRRARWDVRRASRARPLRWRWRPLAHNIAERYAAGGYIWWEGLRIDYVETPPSSGGVVLSTVHAFSAPMTLKDSSARPEQHLAGRRVTYLVGVKSRPNSSLGVTSVTYG